ncbi:MAG: hypothetical protein MUP58_00205 [Candidatus Nanohaloarchaeota archaeon QJJ-9]|nr:hypothetical protein [Candidatus Nanohaloarchaeota archaeon QJJ-9]
MAKIEIEMDDEGKFNTNSGFDLATTILILEKVKSELVQRAQIEKQENED